MIRRWDKQDLKKKKRIDRYVFIIFHLHYRGLSKIERKAA